MRMRGAKQFILDFSASSVSQCGDDGVEDKKEYCTYSKQGPLIGYRILWRYMVVLVSWTVLLYGKYRW